MPAPQDEPAQIPSGVDFGPLAGEHLVAHRLEQATGIAHVADAHGLHWAALERAVLEQLRRRERG